MKAGRGTADQKRKEEEQGRASISRPRSHSERPEARSGGLLGVSSWGPASALPTDLPQELGHDLDLLAAAEQVAEGHASDACHLHGVHQHHEPLQQPQGQEGILEAVHGQPAARLVIPVLGTGTDGISGDGGGRGDSGSGRGRGSGCGAGGGKSGS